MSETDLQRVIEETLNLMGVWVIRTAVNRNRNGIGVRTGEPGMPDLWTEYGWLEVKLPGKELDPDQVTWHNRARKRHINVETVRSVNDAVTAVLTWRRKRGELKQAVSTAANGLSSLISCLVGQALLVAEESMGAEHLSS